MNNPLRFAFVSTTATADTIAAYLPTNYDVVVSTDAGHLVEGRDDAGWTLDGYVIPRLASGLYRAVELGRAR
jgi:hypothetical protein